MGNSYFSRNSALVNKFKILLKKKKSSVDSTKFYKHTAQVHIVSFLQVLQKIQFPLDTGNLNLKQTNKITKTTTKKKPNRTPRTKKYNPKKAFYF